MPCPKKSKAQRAAINIAKARKAGHRIPRGLGEAIQNVSGTTGLRKEVFPAKSASEKPRGGAIQVPKYKSGSAQSKAENYWR